MRRVVVVFWLRLSTSTCCALCARVGRPTGDPEEFSGLAVCGMCGVCAVRARACAWVALRFERGVRVGRAAF